MFSKLIPILPVSDVRKEHILFGLALAPLAPPLTDAGLCWQLETTDIAAVHARAVEHAVRVIEPPTLQPWGRRTMKLGSPCGYAVGFEEV